MNRAYFDYRKTEFAPWPNCLKPRYTGRRIVVWIEDFEGEGRPFYCMSMKDADAIIAHHPADKYTRIMIFQHEYGNEWVEDERRRV